MLAYRREIDGLRAVAVLSVILFHAGFQRFGGGYVGVDVFFVISGFLITSILLDERDGKRFNLRKFYERRARRILPALFLVILCTLPFAWVWMSPVQMTEFAESLLAVETFSSNYLFWKQTGYFDGATDLKPLLHTWSLAVEEQYYLGFPLLMLALHRVSRRWTIVVLGIIALVSLAYCEWASRHAAAANFYFIQSRAWELLLGALLAFHYAKHPVAAKPGTHQLGSLLGLIGVLMPVFFYQKTTPFPSLYAVTPTMGAVLVILYAHSGNWVGRLLGSRPLVGIGLISYSAYLWHQPLFAFFRLRTGNYDVWVHLGLGMVALGLAWLSWRYVERPFRDRGRISMRRFCFLAALIAMALAVFGALGHVSEGFQGRLQPYQNAVYRTFGNPDIHRYYRMGVCQLGEMQHYEDYPAECFGDDDSGREKVVLWGDSMMSGLRLAVQEAYPNRIVQQLVYAACTPILNYDFDYKFRRPFCHDTWEKVARHIIEDPKVTTVYMMGAWRNILPETQNRRVAETVRYLLAHKPSLKIYVIGPLPRFEQLDQILARNLDHPSGMIYLPRDYEAPDLEGGESIAPEAIDERLSKALAGSGAIYLSPIRLMCPDKLCPVADFTDPKHPKIWSFDAMHLTQWGAQMLERRMLQEIGAQEAARLR